VSRIPARRLFEPADGVAMRDCNRWTIPIRQYQLLILGSRGLSRMHLRIQQLYRWQLEIAGFEHPQRRQICRT
jgi:hypothetical protein